MAGITENTLIKHHTIDPQTLSFEERLQFGAENAIRCMGVTGQDRVFIITDYARESIARRVAAVALDRHADVTVRFLEHYGERPLTAFPDTLRQDLLNAHPTVTYYIATAQPGEIAFRIPLLPFLATELKTRHGHMIGIDENVMAEGMCANYDEVFSLTNQVYDIVRNAKTIHVTSAKGSDVTGTFHPDCAGCPVMVAITSKANGAIYRKARYLPLPQQWMACWSATFSAISSRQSTVYLNNLY